MRFFTRLAASLLAACVLTPVLAQTTVKTVSYSGTGCPTGSVGVGISADGHTLQLIFDSYVATTGPGIASTEASKDCNLVLGLHFSRGVEVTLISADYRGFASLTSGSIGVAVAYYRWSATGAVVGTASTQMVGPVSEDYLMSSSFSTNSNYTSTCGQNVNLYISSLIDIIPSGSGSNELTLDSEDGTFVQTLGTVVTPC